MFNKKKPLRNYQSSLLSLTHGFGTKLLGDGRNYSVTASIGDSPSIVTPQQVHSTNIKIITDRAGASLKPKETDGLITQLPNVLLTVITADCVPIIFHDPKKQIIGISHQGWKGTLNKLPEKMVNQFIQLGASLSDITVAIGPCINDCCYEVSAELANEFVTAFGESVVSNRSGKIFLNLLKTNVHILTSMGITPDHIDFFPFCTSCQKDKFWSYRRDGGIEGEMMSFVKNSSYSLF